MRGEPRIICRQIPNQETICRNVIITKMECHLVTKDETQMQHDGCFASRISANRPRAASRGTVQSSIYGTKEVPYLARGGGSANTQFASNSSKSCLSVLSVCVSQSKLCTTNSYLAHALMLSSIG